MGSGPFFPASSRDVNALSWLKTNGRLVSSASAGKAATTNGYVGIHDDASDYQPAEYCPTSVGTHNIGPGKFSRMS